MPDKRRAAGAGSPKTYLSRLTKSVWLFPVLLFIVLLFFTAFKISGTSVGMYYPILYGTSQKDPDLLTGKPQPIRSDEWLYITQMTISQHASGYPRVNHNIDYGRDMSVVGDAPYKDWSAVFKPQNVMFFVLPLAYAFALKWWLLLFLVIVSCYFFTLRFLKNKRLLASLLALAFGFSPFLFWWYQTATFAPLFYGFLLMILGIRIINHEKIAWLKNQAYRYSLGIYCAAFAYLLTCFALILYPPFQIPIAIVVAAFLAGYLLSKQGFKNLLTKKSLTAIGAFAISVVLTAGLVFTFVATRSEAVSAVEHTVYPGNRVVSAGTEIPVNLLSSYLQPQLQSKDHGQQYYDNQSESSDFIMLLPFLLIPGFVLIYIEYRQTGRLNWPFLAIQLCAVLFLADLFIGRLQPLYNLFLLNKVPLARLRIGLGFAGFLQLVFIIKSMANIKLTKKVYALVLAYAALCLYVLLRAGQSTKHNYPFFIDNRSAIIFWALIVTVVLACILLRRALLGVAVLLVFSVVSVIHIHPLYRGLGPLDNSALTQAIDNVSKPGSTWVAVDDVAIENVPAMSNRNSLSGIQTYPDINFWRQVNGPKDDYIYNRYAHVVFTSNPLGADKLRLVSADSFEVQLSCDAFIKQHVQYAVSDHPLPEPCLQKIKTVQYPSTTFYLYKIN